MTLAEQFYLEDMPDSDTIKRLVLSIGTVAVDRGYGVPLTIDGLEVYKYFFEMTKEMEERPREGACAALLLTLRMKYGRPGNHEPPPREPDQDPIPF